MHSCMNNFLSNERSRWLFLIGLVAIGSGVTYSVLTHDCDSVEVVNAFELHEEKSIQNKQIKYDGYILE